MLAAKAQQQPDGVPQSGGLLPTAPPKTEGPKKDPEHYRRLLDEKFVRGDDGRSVIFETGKAPLSLSRFVSKLRAVRTDNGNRSIPEEEWGLWAIRQFDGAFKESLYDYWNAFHTSYGRVPTFAELEAEIFKKGEVHDTLKVELGKVGGMRQQDDESVVEFVNRVKNESSILLRQGVPPEDVTWVRMMAIHQGVRNGKVRELLSQLTLPNARRPDKYIEEVEASEAHLRMAGISTRPKDNVRKQDMRGEAQHVPRLCPALAKGIPCEFHQRGRCKFDHPDNSRSQKSSSANATAGSGAYNPAQGIKSQINSVDFEADHPPPSARGYMILPERAHEFLVGDTAFQLAGPQRVGADDGATVNPISARWAESLVANGCAEWDEDLPMSVAFGNGESVRTDEAVIVKMYHIASDSWHHVRFSVTPNFSRRWLLGRSGLCQLGLLSLTPKRPFAWSRRGTRPRSSIWNGSRRRDNLAKNHY
jgi:hypothetical protein